MPYVLAFVAGAAMMFGGMYVSTAKVIDLSALAEQGIPLDLGKTIATIGVLLILFPVIKFFFITPLMEAIQTRNSDLEKTFSEAENLRAEMASMKTDYERRLADTEAKAREQIQAQIREAQELRKSLMAEATARADEMVKRAQDEIEAERQKALGGIRLQVANLSLLAAERILKENVDTERNRKIVDEFIDTVEVPTS
jgi:F-type H+-transporting ATPase subunit b